jgi:hypothetical protein
MFDMAYNTTTMADADDICVCGESLARHYDEQAPLVCDEFRMDLAKSPLLVPQDLVTLSESLDGDFCSIEHQTQAEDIVEKIARMLFGTSMKAIREKHPLGERRK